MSECIGMTRAQLEATAIASAAVEGLDASKYTPERLIEMGIVKRCSVHPDHFISTTWGKRR